MKTKAETKKPLRYKGIEGHVAWYPEDGVWYGRLDNIPSNFTISFQTENEDDIKERFVEAVKDYLDLLKDYKSRQKKPLVRPRKAAKKKTARRKKALA